MKENSIKRQERGRIFRKRSADPMHLLMFLKKHLWSESKCGTRRGRVPSAFPLGFTTARSWHDNIYFKKPLVVTPDLMLTKTLLDRNANWHYLAQISWHTLRTIFVVIDFWSFLDLCATSQHFVSNIFRNTLFSSVRSLPCDLAPRAHIYSHNTPGDSLGWKPAVSPGEIFTWECCKLALSTVRFWEIYSCDEYFFFFFAKKL